MPTDAEQTSAKKGEMITQKEATARKLIGSLICVGSTCAMYALGPQVANPGVWSLLYSSGAVTMLTGQYSL
jgi:hypothetical protein